MAGGLAYNGGADVGLSSPQHPIRATPWCATAPRGTRLFQTFWLLTLLHPPAYRFLANWMDNLRRVSGLLRTRALKPVPPEQTMLCCTTIYTQAPSLLHQSCSLWLILNKSWLAALAQERPDLLEEPVAGKQGDCIQQSRNPILPRRTLPLLAAKAERELYQQWNLRGNTQNEGPPIWETQ